jgi:lipoprotein-releasing system permease protein
VSERVGSLEWRIAWRHLRVGERHPAWVDALLLVAAFLLLVGGGFIAWAVHIGPEPVAGEQIFSVGASSALQRQFGVFGGLSIVLGVMALVLAALGRFFNLLATIITMSVLLGCMALVVVLSLMSGLEADLRDKILAQKAHLRVSAVDGHRFTDYEALTNALAALPEVAGASPYLEAEIMIRSGINRQGAVLLGVQPERLLSVSNIAEIVKEGSFDTLVDPASIPDPDPFALSDPETPWRLRHLDDDDDEISIRRKPAPIEVQRGEDDEPAPKPIPLPDLEPRGEAPKLPPLPGAPPGTPGFDLQGRPKGFGKPFGEGGDDEGWEDPVEELGTELALGKGDHAKFEAPPSARGREGGEVATGGSASLEDAADDGPPADDDDDDGAADEWEDPLEVLDLSGESESGEGESGESGNETGDDGDETGDGGDDGAGEPSDPPRRAPIVDPILIGRELANELAVGVGARVQLITPVGRLTPAGRVPGILAAKVGGVFHSGMYEYDRKNVYMPLPVAQAFLRTGDRVSGIEVKLHDIEALEAGQQAVRAELERLGRGELIVESWKELNRNLFSAMFLEKIAMFVALLFVVLVASFGILASNLMSVLEKSKEIAILKAMGAPDKLIQRVFVAEGLVLGLLGAAGGIAIGLSLCWALDRFGFPFNENVYYIERLPVVVNPLEVTVVGFAALAIVWLSSLYPARVASRMRPVDGLRHQDK